MEHNLPYISFLRSFDESYIIRLLTTTFTEASFNFEMNRKQIRSVCHCLYDQAVSCLIHYYCGVGLSVRQAMC